ncbi:MAG TPA: fibronectin type III domain-containing protein [Frankiaceae bacterium]|nr:fibronectin type III domain-containing protein [Frankiaceae bacterium]
MPRGRTPRYATPLVALAVVVVAPASVAYATTADHAVAVREPEVVSLTADPSVVETGTAPAAIAIAARLTDGYGVTSVAARVPGAETVPLALVSGTGIDGTWTGVVTVPALTAYGPVSITLDALSANGAASSPVVDTALTVADPLPAAPAAVTAVASAGSLAVSWQPPPANGGSAVTAYDVTAVPAPGSDPLASFPAVVSTGADARSATVSGLSEGTRYVVRVAARNATGTGPTATADATTALGVLTVPDAPTALDAAPADRALDVSWTVPASSGGSALTWYEVSAVPRDPYVATPKPVVVDAATPAATVTGLVNGVAYDVAVTARNVVGASLPAAAVATPFTVPAAPKVTGVTAGNARAVVTWSSPPTNGGSPVTSYTVTANPGGTVATLPATARTATITRLANGTPVTFTVKASNAAGAGPASAPSASVVPRLPAKLTVVTQPAASVVYGSASAVVASLTAAGVALPGQRVELFAQVRPSTTWRRVAAGTTGSTGRVTLRTTLPATAALRLHHPAGVALAPDVAVRAVYVKTRVTAYPSSKSIRLGQTLTVRGNVAPAHPVGSVVRLQRYVSGEWRNVVSGRMTTSTAYRVSFRPGAVASYPMRVVKPADADHASGISAKWSQTVAPENARDIALDIRADGSITLETTHVSGVLDQAHSKANVVDVSEGQLARRSAYQNAPGGFTTLDRRMLKALRRMGAVGRVTVSEIAGGSHSRGSLHYSGRAIDISWVNGAHVSRGSSYGLVLDACRAFGAARIFHPRYDPYGGHQGHVHCDW